MRSHLPTTPGADEQVPPRNVGRCFSFRDRKPTVLHVGSAGVSNPLRGDRAFAAAVRALESPLRAPKAISPLHATERNVGLLDESTKSTANGPRATAGALAISQPPPGALAIH